MKNNKPGALQQFFKNEGRKKPYIHPETEKNMSNVPPAETEAVNTLPSNKKTYALFFLLLFLLLFTGGANYLVLTRGPDQAYTDVMQALDNTLELEVNGQASNAELQQQALDAIRLELEAWERITMEALRLFYSTPVQPGNKRTICIKRGGQSSCRTINHTVDSTMY